MSEHAWHVCAICGEQSYILRSGFAFCALHHAEVEARIEAAREARKRVDIGRIVLALRGEAATDYTLRSIPEELWRRVKSHAAAEGRTVREVVLGLLERYAAGGDR